MFDRWFFHPRHPWMPVVGTMVFLYVICGIGYLIKHLF